MPADPHATDPLVCPRCGAEAATDYCGTCGLRLTDLDELPRRSTWRPETIDAGPSSTTKRDPLRTRVIAGVSVALVAVLVVIAALAGGQSDSPPPLADTDTVSTVDPGPPPEQRCVNLWNGSAERDDRFRNRPADAYVSVGFLAEYPDRCVVTVASLSTTPALAFIYRENRSSSERNYDLIFSGLTDQLPETNTDWNATMDSTGDVALDS